MKKNLVIILILAAVCVLLRLYQLPTLTDWSGDSGGDLLIARNILFFGHRPLVGPFLTVDNIFLPPLYFYILAGVLWFVGSPLGVVGFFFVINMIVGVTLGLLAGSMIDASAGVILFALFAVSATLVEHGRSFYQPYMLEPFFTLCLYLLWIAMRSGRTKYLICSLISFSIAAAIYPSPWLLMPYMLYLVYRFIREYFSKFNNAYAVILAVALLGAGSIPIYIPWFVHEFQYGFPTLNAISKNDFGGVSNFMSWPQLYADYLYQLLNQFFGIESIISPPYSYYAAVVVMAVVAAAGFQISRSLRLLRGSRQDIYGKALSFIDIRWFALSFVPMIFFWERAYHRLWVYLPLLLLISTVVIRLALESRDKALRFWMICLVLLYCIGNVSANMQRMHSSSKNSLGNTENASRVILADAQERGIDNYNYQVLYYTPYGYGNYNLATILYFLQEYGGYPIRFLKHGNDVERLSINTPDTDAVYLICRWDIPAKESSEKCNDFFLGQNPNYVLDAVAVLPIGKIFIYIKINK